MLYCHPITIYINAMSDSKKVAIYTTPTCQYCKSAKEFFKENNIAYEEYNVVDDEAKRAEMIEKSGQMGVPVITVADELVVGFDRSRLAELLNVSA